MLVCMVSQTCGRIDFQLPTAAAWHALCRHAALRRTVPGLPHAARPSRPDVRGIRCRRATGPTAGRRQPLLVLCTVLEILSRLSHGSVGQQKENKLSTCPCPIRLGSTLRAEHPEMQPQTPRTVAKLRAFAHTQAACREPLLGDLLALVVHYLQQPLQTTALMDVIIWDLETDLVALQQEIRSLRIEGVQWREMTPIPVAYGICKLRVAMLLRGEGRLDAAMDAVAGLEEHVRAIDLCSVCKV
eukprot:TRINITY_DN19303_c0_g1_i3.p1 TRINITY_DN19303_c0_g1~~TRINITY_DN19303_c0_g1_i3.p1  ORF type:complete len:243 (+),score=23.22 TRINITY_DN19303_c0_g1_i3:1544-2272(+)